jgi:predicted dehydrogenase
MKALLVGAGGMGRTWAKNLLENEQVELAGWVDVIPGQVERSAAEVGAKVSAFTSVETGLRETKPDFVVDVSIPEAHEEITIQCLNQGVPVIGEKPMSTSIASAKRMVRASEVNGILYMVSQSRRYNKNLYAFRELIQKLGTLGILNADFFIGAHFGGFRDEMDNVLILDMAIHTFDAARAISGLNPVSVFADQFNPVWSWYKQDSSAICLFEMEQGARFTYRGSWCSEGLHTSWESDWRAVCEKGTGAWDGNETIKGEIVRAPNGFHSSFEEIEPPIHEAKYGIAASLDDFLMALKTGSTPQGECHDNILSLAMVFAAIESSKRKEVVQISEILA